MTAATPPFRVLIDRDQIVRRTREIARALLEALGDEPPLLVMVVEGARPFARLLQAALPGTLPLVAVRARSYVGTESSGEVAITPLDGFEGQAARGRDVVLLEDIVDTGRTMQALRDWFAAAGARSVRVATLLSKPDRRVVDVPIEHVGFVIPDEFVVGCGMDLDGRYRELPDVVVYDATVERSAAAEA